MPNKGLLLALVLSLLSACDSSTESAAPAAASQAPAAAPAPAVDLPALATRHAGQPLRLLDASEVQLQGASSLSLSFSVPLDPEQPFERLLHLVDSKSGKVDGAWELSDNLMELTLRPLEPQRTLVLTLEAGLRSVAGERLGEEQVVQLETRELRPSVGFASRGSLLPTRLAEGLPVIALNVERVNVEFFRVRDEALPGFLARWGRASSLDNWEARELLPLAELVYGGRFDLKPARNTRETLLLPLSGIPALQQPGVYLAVMREAGSYSYSQPATLFSLSDIGLSAHRFGKRLDVFTQALAGGGSIEGVTLELIDAEGRIQASAQTDASGHAQLALPAKAEVLLARLGAQTSLLRLNAPALDLAEFDIGGAPAHPQQFFVFGPRDLYRPGESVLLNALLRDADGRLLPPRPVNVEVRRPDGQTSRSFVWTADAGGLYQYALPLAADAPTGRWQLLFELGDGRPQLHEILVEDFLPERLALELKGSAEPLRPGLDAQFAVEGRYLYGAPAAGNRLLGQLYVRPAREAVASLPGYQFGSVSETELNQDLELDEQTLDADGKARIVMESRWAEARSPLNLILQASLQESAGRPVTRRLVQPVWPAERLPGLRGLYEGEEVDAQSRAEFELLVADFAGNKLAAEGLKVRLVRERRDYFWSFSESDGWSHNYNEKQLLLAEERVNVPAGGTARVAFDLDWGPYRVEVEDPASGMLSSLRVWAGWRWQDNAEGGAVRPDQVKLALDRPAYAEGQTAQVTVTPPAAGKGYLMLESSEGPLWWQEIEVPAEGRTFELPIAADWARHDLYLSALVVRPGERKSGATPKRAVGLLHLPLDRAPRKLALELEAPQKMRPGQPLRIAVQARNADGSPAREAQVLLAAVDSGILNITEFKTPDPFLGLFGRKAYSADQLDVYGQLIEAGQGRLASLAFGGDAALAAGGKKPDSSVLIVALQSQPLQLDAQGRGEVSLDIPDFNGELRLMAQAWTDERYGAAEAKTLVAAPVVAELAAPRFLAGGDRTALALDLSNLSGAAQTLQVSLAGSGQIALEGAASHSLSLADGERRTLSIPLRALGGLGEGQLRLRVEGLQLPGETLPVLEREWRLGVRPAWPAQLVHYREVLKEQPWQLPADALLGFDPVGLQASLSLSSRPPLNLGEQIRALKAYPYGCLEQTTSGLYPSLYADAALLKRLGLEGEPDAQRRRAIELGIERLLGMQRHNGSFGLWGADGDEEYWLSAYVTDFLLRAREQGFGVPEAALKRASERLLRYLQEPSLIEPSYSEDAAHTRFAVQAYAGYVLARSQQAPLGALRSLFERREQAQSGLPLVQLAVALQRMGDAPRADQALQAGLALKRSGRHWYGDYGSPLRDQALMLALLQEHGMASEQLDAQLFVLSDSLAGRNGLSTQESNALFLAGRHLLQRPEGDWRATLEVAGQRRELSAQQSELRLEGDALQLPLSLARSAGVEPLYQRLTLSGYPLQAPPAFAENLEIRREYLGLDGRRIDLDNLQSGELVLVHIALNAEERVADALVVDLLPAGLELENQNLANGAASLTDAGGAVADWLKSMGNAAIKHQEYRGDRYVAALVVEPWDTTHLLYLARAVTPGDYRVPPPQVESMYRPQWQALGESPGLLRVRPRD